MENINGLISVESVEITPTGKWINLDFVGLDPEIILEYLKTDDILDYVGREKCKEYFDLTEKE